MGEYLSYGGYGGTATRDQTHTLFGQTMGYVAVTGGFFALGAYLGRNLHPGWAIVGFIAAFVCLISMNFTVRRAGTVTAGLLFPVGVLLGVAVLPALLYHTATNPPARWEAGGAGAPVRPRLRSIGDSAPP